VQLFSQQVGWRDNATNVLSFPEYMGCETAAFG